MRVDDRRSAAVTNPERRLFLRRTALFTGALASGALAAPSDLIARAGAEPAAAAAPGPPAFVRGTEVGSALTLGGLLMSTLARKETTGGVYGLMEGWAQPGVEPPPHIHANEDESVQLLEGRL
ncbi:MAG TPA: hypothetical protein VKU40_00850, partial [Thermoanaerobaculia bacterium]|nr:hypothetical protein [Thermoanaerobaculia bacterium]